MADATRVVDKLIGMLGVSQRELAIALAELDEIREQRDNLLATSSSKKEELE